MANSILDDLLGRYEVGTIINDNRDIICGTNDLELANKEYEDAVKKFITDKEIVEEHIVVFLYDYDKNANINYVDNCPDIS